MDPVVSKFLFTILCTFFFCLSIRHFGIRSLLGPVHNLLESGAVVDDALYYDNVNDVACMD